MGEDLIPFSGPGSVFKKLELSKLFSLSFIFDLSRNFLEYFFLYIYIYIFVC